MASQWLLDRSLPPIDRFVRRFRPTEDGCWVWLGHLSSAGYPEFAWAGGLRAHRFSCEFYNGAIPDGYTVDHLCKNPPCVNPDHLEAVPMRENLLRSDGPSGLNARKTSCPEGHPYSGENLILRGGSRRCRACQDARNAAFVARRSEQRRLAREARGVYPFRKRPA